MLFRTCGRDDQQGAVAAKWLIEHAKGKKIAIVHDKSTYGKGLADVDARQGDGHRSASRTCFTKA